MEYLAFIGKAYSTGNFPGKVVVLVVRAEHKQVAIAAVVPVFKTRIIHIKPQCYKVFLFEGLLQLG